MKPETQALPLELPIYGILAEFDNPEDLVSAARETRHAGYRKMDAYTPFPVEGLNEALELGRTWVPLLVLIGGILGAGLGYFLQYYISVIDYPLNIGGRPLHSWPAFIPVTFEMTVLVAGLFAVLGMLALNGLPMPYHPIFNVPYFSLATHDRFFLCIEAADLKFDRAATRRFLEGLGPRRVSEVEL
ncbi:MAG TPA: DUF3341 domain-containing protein [Candidatus Binatia bacterium]|nr:DUF3341 domain-containing protein [Candidatus Binatia bacterium]